LYKCGGRKPNEQRFVIGLWLGQKFFNLAFVLFIFLHIFIQHLFRAEGILIPHLHKALPLCAMQFEKFDRLKIFIFYSPILLKSILFLGLEIETIFLKLLLLYSRFVL
jgi:hypothetical protein